MVSPEVTMQAVSGWKALATMTVDEREIETRGKCSKFLIGWSEGGVQISK